MKAILFSLITVASISTFANDICSDVKTKKILRSCLDCSDSVKQNLEFHCADEVAANEDAKIAFAQALINQGLNNKVLGQKGLEEIQIKVIQKALNAANVQSTADYMDKTVIDLNDCTTKAISSCASISTKIGQQ